ncbi:MAG: glycosyltransferase [Thermoplasmata archaeon]|nr:glycosyltransferase [Thermoplasmata archaeon]
MSSVCVEIAVRDDPHLVVALGSLVGQTRTPDRVLIAASQDSSVDFLQSAVRAHPSLKIQFARFSGGVVGARAGAQALVLEEITAFLDSDERAPPGWLAQIVGPIERGEADFTGGPTRPSQPARSSVEEYMQLLEGSIYGELVPSRVTYLPLQNTAWRSRVLQDLGFDPRIPFAEDHDLETRAVQAGLRGTFVPGAWVYHDTEPGVTHFQWARKRYRYLVAMTMSLVKNHELGRRLGEHRVPVRHRLRWVEGAMKPVALVHGRVRWSRVRRRPLVVPRPVPEPTA